MSQQHLIDSLPIEVLKQQAKRLRDHLARTGLADLKHTQALHAIAAQWEFGNWQTLEARYAAAREGWPELRKHRHVLKQSEEPMDQRMDDTRAKVLEVFLANPVVQDEETSAQVLELLQAPPAIEDPSVRIWLAAAAHLARVIRQVAHHEDRGDPLDDVDAFLLALADLMLEDRFRKVANIVLGSQVLMQLSPIRQQLVDAALKSGFFGKTSEALRLTFCRHFGLALEARNSNGGFRG